MSAPGVSRNQARWLVPEAVAGAGPPRGTLGGHRDRAGRRARGLEGALVEHSLHVLRALVTADLRAFEIQVAGPSALLVAKVHKIADRSQEPAGKRGNDKDGLDVLRLLRVIPSRELAAGLMRLQRETVPAEVTLEAVAQLDVLFVDPVHRHADGRSSH